MTGHIWYIGAASDVMSNTGYVAGTRQGPEGEANFARFRNLQWRIQIGERIDPEEVPTDYSLSSPKANANLKLPVWQSDLLHVRRDVAAVLSRFDIGNTLLVPIHISLPDNGGVNEDYLMIGVCNLKPTIDSAQSEPLGRGAKRRTPLRCTGPEHKGVMAHASAAQGVDIWTDPEVAKTVFVSERLAFALKAEPYARLLKLKKVRMAASGQDIAP